MANIVWHLQIWHVVKFDQASGYTKKIADPYIFPYLGSQHSFSMPAVNKKWLYEETSLAINSGVLPFKQG